jgi:SET family sugar efflux transporter-like MFS transporter
MSMFGINGVGMSPMVFGVFMTISSVSAIVISTWLAHWSDTRWSRRHMLVAGALCGALGYASYAFIRDVVWLTVAGAILIGVASISFSQLFAHAREMLAQSSVAASDTALYMNVFRLFFALSWTFGPATASWVMEYYSFRGTFLVAAAVFVLFLIAVLRYVPHRPPQAQAAGKEPLPLRRALTRPVVLAHFFALSLVFTATTIAMSNLPMLIRETLGGTQRQVGIAYSVAPVFELPLMFFFGLLATRGDHARLIRIAVLLAVGYYAALTFVAAPWQVYPLQIISAAVVAVVSGIAITFFQNFLPDQVGTATNLYSTAMRVGGTAGYLVFGVFAQAYGYRAVFALCAGLCTVAFAILFAWRSRSQSATSALPTTKAAG